MVNTKMQTQSDNHKIRIAFTDFWDGFEDQNWFKSFLSRHFNIEICETDPEAVIFSDFGDDYMQYPCTRIYYTGENSRPDFQRCDYAFTFDYCDDPRHYRLPLYRLYFNERDMTANHNADAILAQNRKFCCMVVSNPRATERLDFFRELSRYKRVDSGGKVMNNIGRRVQNKRAFIRNYRFTFAFENAAYPGYTTEKLVEAWIEGSIPIYWGNPRIIDEFNPECFINLNDYPSWELAAERVCEVDSDPALMHHMLRQPLLRNNIVPDYLRESRIADRFRSIFADGSASPTWRRKCERFLHAAKKLKRAVCALP
mgnify:FL=1